MKRVSNKLLSLLLAGIIISSLAFPAVAATSRTYTTNADFDEGALVGVEHTTVADQLQLSSQQTTLPFIWVPNSPVGSVSKVDTVTGNELGRYYVAPPNIGGNPSRTTVDLKGNVWVGTRQAGTVVKIGLLEAGECKDRNSNGNIETSTDSNNDGDITGAEQLPWGQDECVLYEVVLIPGKEGTFVPGTYAGTYDTNYWGTAPRGLAIDSGNNIWVGTSGTRRLFYINGETGAIEQNLDISADSGSYGVYGAVMDGNGKLWLTSLYANVREFDPVSKTMTKVIPLGHTYGIGLDYEGNVLIGGSAQISKIRTSDGVKLWTRNAWANQGITATSDNNIWTGNSNGIGKHNSEATQLQFFNMGTITGVAVDAAGKIWGSEMSEYIRRIDPATNTVDLNKRLIGSGSHYTYSDMTGIMARTITTRIGTWTVDHNSGAAGTTWGKVSWNGNTPAGTSIVVKVRSSPDGITWGGWETASNGVSLSSTPAGQYLQVQTTLQIISGDVSPILYDLTVESSDGSTNIPEFPTVALPILSVLGLVALMYHRRREE